MYLSDRDLKFAVETGQLIVDPAPTEYDTTSIDLHLDNVNEAKIWDVKAFKQKQESTGNDSWLRVGKYKYRTFSQEFYLSVPTDSDPSNLVYRNGDRVILRPMGFLLWQTHEAVGTPEIDPRLICFINGKRSQGDRKLAQMGILKVKS